MPSNRLPFISCLLMLACALGILGIASWTYSWTLARPDGWIVAIMATMTVVAYIAGLAMPNRSQGAGTLQSAVLAMGSFIVGIAIVAFNAAIFYAWTREGETFGGVMGTLLPPATATLAFIAAWLMPEGEFL